LVPPLLVMDHAKKFELDFVFHSNKIEGNKLSRGQTESALQTNALHSLSTEEKEVANLRDAYRWVLDTYESSIESTGSYLREVNKILLRGIENEAGAYRTKDVDISGVDYTPPPWGSVDNYMQSLTDEIRSSKGKTSGIELAVRAHTKFVAIHPFVDGNGRSARLLMSAILLAHDLPILILNSDDKSRYLTALEYSNDGALDSLLSLFLDIMKQTLSEFSDRGLNAGSLEVEDTSSVLQVVSNPESSNQVKDNESSSVDPRKRLLNRLKQKTHKRRESNKVTYEAWKNAFEMFRNELSSYLEDLDQLEEFREAGYVIDFETYDLVTEDRFDAFWARRDMSKTWCSSVVISNSIDSYGLMLEFECVSERLRRLVPAIAPVSCKLAIGGEKTGNWLPLKSEPIKLREIGYMDGDLVFLDDNSELIKSGLTQIFDELLGDLLGE